MWDFLVYRGLDQIDSYVAQLKQCGLTEEEIDLKVHHDHQDLVKVCVDCLVYRDLDQIDSYVAELKQCGLTEEEIDLKVHHDHPDLVKVIKCGTFWSIGAWTK